MVGRYDVAILNAQKLSQQCDTINLYPDIYIDSLCAIGEEKNCHKEVI